MAHLYIFRKKQRSNAKALSCKRCAWTKPCSMAWWQHSLQCLRSSLASWNVQGPPILVEGKYLPNLMPVLGMCCSYKKKGLCLKWSHIYVYMHILYNCIRWFDIVKVLVAFGRFTVFWSHQILIRFNKQMWLHKHANCLTTTGYLVLTKLCGARFGADPCSGSILKNPGRNLAGCFPPVQPPVQPPMKADYWLSITSCVYRSCFFW